MRATTGSRRRANISRSRVKTPRANNNPTGAPLIIKYPGPPARPDSMKAHPRERSSAAAWQPAAGRCKETRVPRDAAPANEPEDANQSQDAGSLPPRCSRLCGNPFSPRPPECTPWVRQPGLYVGPLCVSVWLGCSLCGPPCVLRRRRRRRPSPCRARRNIGPYYRP